MGDLLLQWHASLADPERIPLAMAALLLVLLVGMITGPLGGNAGPLLWNMFDRTLGRLADRLDRTHRPRADLLFRGFIVSAVTLVITLFIGEFFVEILRDDPAYGLPEILILSITMSGGAVWFCLLRLYFALEKKQAKAGDYYAISRSTRSNLALSDDYGITRVSIGYVARSFDKGVVSPVFWYFIGGLPLALIYGVIAALAWRLGKDGFSKGFGAVPLALERLMGFVPSLLAAFLLTCAGLFTPTASLSRGVVSWLGHKNRAKYEEGGFPLSALAWSLNISLGGASQDLSGSALKAAWVGPDGASARIKHDHLRRALYMSVMAHILFLATLGGAYVWGSFIF